MKWAILTLISIFICMCCAQMLEWDAAGNLIAHSFSIWGDWSAHFTFISNILNRGPHWISGDNPVFYGMPFQYPFLSHLITAGIAYITNLDVPRTTFYTSIALLFTLPFVLYYFFKSIGLSLRQSILAILLFLFLGGLQAFDGSLNANDPLTNQFNSGSVFTQIVLFELFPQRAFLFGMIALLLGLGFSFNRIQRENFNRKHFIGMALYFSLLSWMHIHSWIAAGAVLLIYCLFNLIYTATKNAPSVKTQSIFNFGLSVVLFSSPFIYFLLFRNNSNHSTPSAANLSWQMWYPGWAQNPSAALPGANEMNPISFWIYNTGIFLPLVVAGKILLWKRNPKESISSLFGSPLFVLATTGGILFLVAEFINIQPYFYDNLKLFTYAFLFLTPFAAVGLDALFEKKYLIPVGILLLGGQIYTASQDYLFFKNQVQSTSFLTLEEFDLAEKFRELRRSPESLVLISPKHNHWIPTLTGNPILMGYPGWLWTWGISYNSREAEVNEILAGGPHASELLATYPIEYIVVNDHDQAGKLPVSINFLKEHSTLLMEHGAWHVFAMHH